MASASYPSLQRLRFGAQCTSPHDKANAHRILQLLLAQDGSTTRLCESVAAGPVRLHLLAQTVTTKVPDAVREALDVKTFIERVTCIAAHGEVMMDNLSYIALDRLDANLRRDLETGTIPIGHLLATSWTRRAALPSTPSLFERLWQYVGLPDQIASRSYRIETPQGSLMLIAETYRQGMLLSATGSPPNA